jgi:hypothetical protein
MERSPERLSVEVRAEYYRGLAVEALAHAQTASPDRKADCLENAAHWAKLAAGLLSLRLDETFEPRLELQTLARGACAELPKISRERRENHKNRTHIGSIW